MLTAHRRGMQGISARDGLPKIRADWVAAREARGDKVCTQQHYAKKGIITEEMAFCAARERIDPEFVRSEVCMHPPVLCMRLTRGMQVPMLGLCGFPNSYIAPG